MRIAVVGLGRMGRFYAQTIASLGPATQLSAVADLDPAARAAVKSQLGVPVVAAEPADVLARADVDAVVIATPTSTHAELVVAAARAGKAIFCEKPLALSLEQTHAALAAVQGAGVLLQVGLMRRFDPGYQHARACIDSGRIGRPLTFKAVGRDPSCPPLGYANPAHSGGLVLDMGIHDFDLARWLMSSEVERVSADGALLVCKQFAEVGDIDNAVVNLRFQSGALGNVEVSRTARYGYDVWTEVLGSEGALVVGRDAGAAATGVQLFTPAGNQTDETPHFVRRFGTAYRAQIEHFVECLEQRRQPSVGGIDALAAFEIAVAATRSWQTGQPVAIGDVREPSAV
ncbi:MAG: inositol 2-dehydrogenase [Chloroflexota bacterium]